MFELFRTCLKNFFKKIKKRDKKILEQKYGLVGEKYSFEKIGIINNFTRQNAQQIVKRQLKKLKKILEGNHNLISCDQVLVQRISCLIHEINEKEIINIEDFRNKFKSTSNDEMWENLFFDIFEMKSFIDIFDKKYICTRNIDLHLAKKYTNGICKIIREKITPINQNDMKILFNEKGYDNKYYCDKVVNAILFEKFPKNGSIYLSLFNPKSSLGDYAAKLLWIKGSQMGKEDLLKEINDYCIENNSDNKAFNMQNMINQIANHKLVMNLGNGNLALKIMGKQKNTVSRTIKNILQNASKPLDKQTIIQEVKKTYPRCKDTTIILNLKKHKFIELENNYFILAEWASKYSGQKKKKKKQRNVDKLVINAYNDLQRKKLTTEELYKYLKTSFPIKYELKGRLKQKKYLYYDEEYDAFILKENYKEIIKESRGDKLDNIIADAECLLKNSHCSYMRYSELISKLEQKGYNKRTSYFALNSEKFKKIGENKHKLIRLSSLDTDTILINNFNSGFELVEFLSNIQSEQDSFDFKQGFLQLNESSRRFDEKSFEKIMQNACALANLGNGKKGYLFIGIADKKSDMDRIGKLDNIKPYPVKNFGIVGLEREAKVLGKDWEKYISYICDRIKSSKIPDALKYQLYGPKHIDLEGKTVLIYEIEGIGNVAYYDEDKVFIRKGPNREEVKNKKEILCIEDRCKKSND